MLKTIFSVSGKTGLYKMISQGKNLSIVESLADQKRIPAYVSDKLISLGNVSIYTNTDNAPLYKVLNSIKEKEKLQKIQMDIPKATPDELRAYFAEVLPDFDNKKVYPTDIKRLMTWYNLLIDAGITEFDPEDEEITETVETDSEEEGKKSKEEVKKTSNPSKTTVQRNPSAPKSATIHTKQQAATGKMRQRTKQK